MLYHLSQFLDQLNLPGAGMWSYVSFRSLLALMISLVISLWLSKKFITYMKKKRHIEQARSAEIDPFGVKKIGVPPSNATTPKPFSDNCFSMGMLNISGRSRINALS